MAIALAVTDDGTIVARMEFPDAEVRILVADDDGAVVYDPYSQVMHIDSLTTDDE